MKHAVRVLTCFLLLSSLVTAADITRLKAVRIIKTGQSDVAAKPTVITGLAMQPGGKTFASVGDDHQVRLWTTSDGAPVTILRGHRDWLRTVVFSPDGTMLATAGDDRRITIWDVAKRTSLRTIPVGTAVYGIDWSRSGDMLAAVGFDNKLRIFTASSGKPLDQHDGPCADLRAVTFSPDGKRVAAAGRNAQVRAWCICDGCISFEIGAGVERIRTLAFSPDGTRLVTSGEGRMVGVWNAQNGEKIADLPCRSAKVLALAFCGDRLLATGGSDNLIRVWNLDTSSEQYQLYGHTGTVAALACDAETGTLVSGSFDTTIRVWKLTDQDEEKVAQPPQDDSSLR